MNKKKAIIIIIPFLLSIYSIFILNLLSKDRDSSEAENRALQQKPTWENVVNKDYGQVYEKYYTDQFVFRDELLKLYTNQQLNINKSKVNGYYIDEEEWVLEEPIINIDEEHMQYLANIINTYSQSLTNDGKEVYYVSAPHKVNSLRQKLPDYINKEYSIQNKDRLLSSFDKDNINIIDLTSEFNNKFTEEEREEFYFKTDHHWNSKGAYEGFKIIVDKISKNNNLKIEIEDEDYKETYIPNKKFLGSYNLNMYGLLDKNEKVPYVDKKESEEKNYYINDGNKFREAHYREIFAKYVNEEELTHAGSYTMDHLNYKIVNSKPIIDKKILIYRDSYHSAMSWMISDVFREVEVVDPRHIDKVNLTSEQVAENTDADIVLFMFNDLSFKDMINQLDSDTKIELDYIK